MDHLVPLTALHLMIKKIRLAAKLKILHGAESLWFGFIHLLACIN